MSFLLDTNVVSEAKRPEPDKQVLRWLAGQPLPTWSWLLVVDTASIA